MKTTLYHIQINILDVTKSIPFYKDLFDYFEYKIIDQSESHLGVSNGTTDFWFIQTEENFKTAAFHRKNTGLNHLAFQVEKRADVNTFVEEFLKPKNIIPLYHSPKEYPEYTENYYAVFFEDPDRMKIEVVFK
ncbi:MAG: VOC family protein [Candidatus Pacebacteria bacterium]|nr:VOC family protein [Candidatus Paceibacterota bacterium]